MDIDWKALLIDRCAASGTAYGELMVLEMIRQGTNTLDEIQAAQSGVDLFTLIEETT